MNIPILGEIELNRYEYSHSRLLSDTQSLLALKEVIVLSSLEISIEKQNDRSTTVSIM